MTQHIDIFVAGGGVAGLSAAIAMADAGFRTLCVDPVPPVTDRTQSGADLRTTAYLQPSQAFLNDIGIWGHIGGDHAALQCMRIADASGDTLVVKDFDASDISDQPFGWNVGNWRMRRALLDRVSTLSKSSHLTFLSGVSCDRIVTRSDHAVLRLSNGDQIRAKLVIAADGRNSMIRQSLNIGTTGRAFGQDALTFAVTHANPHNSVSTEVHKTGGPFTLVPLPDYDGKPCSAVVWMDDRTQTKTRLSMDIAAFEAQITQRSAGVLGPLRLIGHRSAWPIVTQLADQFYGERTAILAEAAHVVPPIGAQGLNMSLTDIECLRDLAVADRNGIGTPAMLRAYHDARRGDVQLRMRGITALNLMSKARNPLINNLRSLGIDAIHGIAPVRKTLMKLGLGAH